jgi:hypothetical protein
VDRLVRRGLDESYDDPEDMSAKRALAAIGVVAAAAAPFAYEDHDAEASCTYTVTDRAGMEMLSGGFELLVARGHARDPRMRRLFPATRTVSRPERKLTACSRSEAARASWSDDSLSIFGDDKGRRLMPARVGSHLHDANRRVNS